LMRGENRSTPKKRRGFDSTGRQKKGRRELRTKKKKEAFFFREKKDFDVTPGKKSRGALLERGKGKASTGEKEKEVNGRQHLGGEESSCDATGEGGKPFAGVKEQSRGKRKSLPREEKGVFADAQKRE